MERIIKILTVLLFLGVFVVPVYSNPAVSDTQVVKPELSNCIKIYPIPYDKLYFLTLTGINEHNYQIKEIQTKGGYIVFEIGNRKFLASIVYVSSSKSMLKITPYSGNYDFPVDVPQNIFKYIETYHNQKF
ncbi:MAG: hypothetical protein K6E29_04535 [Cyanobacteria bacterium RUI128]|nr:hypothetical protein [Cyanobacteria bacterium RUI128]